MNTPDPTVPPVGNEKPVFRMTREDYLIFERTLPTPAVDNNTTDLNAGMKLGVQLVLAAFRTKFVQGL
jgi:hypothetical protein